MLRCARERGERVGGGTSNHLVAQRDVCVYVCVCMCMFICECECVYRLSVVLVFCALSDEMHDPLDMRSKHYGNTLTKGEEGKSKNSRSYSNRRGLMSNSCPISTIQSFSDVTMLGQASRPHVSHSAISLTASMTTLYSSVAKRMRQWGIVGCAG